MFFIISFLEKYIFHKRDKKLYRKIYENCSFDEYETNKIQEIKEEINKEHIKIPEKSAYFFIKISIL